MQSSIPRDKSSARILVDILIDQNKKKLISIKYEIGSKSHYIRYYNQNKSNKTSGSGYYTHDGAMKCQGVIEYLRREKVKHALECRAVLIADAFLSGKPFSSFEKYFYVDTTENRLKYIRHYSIPGVQDAYSRFVNRASKQMNAIHKAKIILGFYELTPPLSMINNHSKLTISRTLKLLENTLLDTWISKTSVDYPIELDIPDKKILA